VNRKILQDFDSVEEHWGQHQETTSEIEALEAEELRRKEGEYAAQQAMEQERIAKEEEQRKWREDEERLEKQAERKKAEKEAARKKKEEEKAAARQKADLGPAADPLGLG
jgi:colicin import membrane protein